MSQNETENTGKDSGTLLPIPGEKRILGLPSYTFAWMGGCISIGTFTLGSSVVETGLNLAQAGIAMLTGSLILIVGLILNDKFCYKTGIPYVVQLKSAFGTKGTIAPALIRAVPAIIWYGVQSWLAGSALNEVSKTLFGFDNMIVFFILFHVFQIILSLTGFKGVKWLENIGAVFILGALFYMFYVCLTTYDVAIDGLIKREGSWGMPFWGAIVSFFGVNIAVMLNCGDYVRELKLGYNAAKRSVAYFIAMVPATVFMGVIGLMITTATNIANPIVAFSTAIENKILVVITLLFIIFAQMTTNLLSNVIPPVYALMDAFRLKHKISAVIVGILAVASCPWFLVRPESAAGLDIFVLAYTAFLGPIFAVLFTDFYILRKEKINLDDLYNENGPYKGANRAAIIAIILGAAIGFINIKLSFFISFIPTAAAYYFLTAKLAPAFLPKNN